MNDEQLNLAIEAAREAAARGDFATAVETQERVVVHVRLKGQRVDDLVTLSVQMFNLADYYTGQERFDDAIRLLEEVVALDERLGLPDIESDRQMLDSVRRLAAMTPAARKQWYHDTPAGQATTTAGPDEVKRLVDQLDMFPAEERAEIEAMMRQMAGLPVEEQLKRALDARSKDTPRPDEEKN